MLNNKPDIIVATPGRLWEILSGVCWIDYARDNSDSNLWRIECNVYGNVEANQVFGVG